MADRSPRLKSIPSPPVDRPADWGIADAGAIQALERGEALPHQQQRALDWILRQASAVGQQSFRESPAQTAFHEGRRFVGLQIVGILKVNLSKLKGTKETQ